MNRTDSISETSPLSETKRRLLEIFLRGEPAPHRKEFDVITRRPSGEPAPLGLAQEQIWLREMAARPQMPAIKRARCRLARNIMPFACRFPPPWSV